MLLAQSLFLDVQNANFLVGESDDSDLRVLIAKPRYCLIDRSMLSKAGAAAATVSLGPVSLKNHGPPGPSMTAPSSLEPGAGSLDPPPIRLGSRVPATSMSASVIHCVLISTSIGLAGSAAHSWSEAV